MIQPQSHYLMICVEFAPINQIQNYTLASLQLLANFKCSAKGKQFSTSNIAWDKLSSLVATTVSICKQ